MITAHTDVVGSLLRPPELLKARSEVAAGQNDASGVQSRRGPSG